MNETVWKDDGHGIGKAGDVGGDIQVGEAYCRRFVHSRLAGRHIEVRAYPVANSQPDPGAEPTISLDVQTELMVATDPEDPGGSEEWSDLEYSDLPEQYERTYPSVEAAEQAAQEYLRQLDPARDFTWDGKPEMGPASLLKYGEMLGKLAHQFSAEQLGEHHSVHAYVQRLAIDNNAFEHRAIKLDYWYERVADREGNVWLVAWLMDTTHCLKGGDEEGGWVVGVYWEPVAPTHTHYSPYGPPRQVVGTLVGCSNEGAHDPKDSERWADYRYMPRLERSGVTGLPAHVERDVLAAYAKNRQEGVEYAITDARTDVDFTYRVRITNRTDYALNEAGPAFHTEEYGLHPDGFWRGIPINPHPGYSHEPPFCPNCGY
jgi:hypothetical protein